MTADQREPGRRIRTHRRKSGEYDVLFGDVLIGEIVLDGRPGVDNYPWTWSLLTGGSRPAASKRDALDHIRYLNGEKR